MPVAEYCNVPFAMTVPLIGVTAMDTRAAGFTVNRSEPDTPPRVALMVAAPWPTPVARPSVPGELLTVAYAVLLELQIAVVVMVCAKAPEPTKPAPVTSDSKVKAKAKAKTDQ